jgi:hypothetical protein
MGRFLIWNNFKIIVIGEFPKDTIIDCNTPILYLYFNYVLYFNFKNNCSAIVNGTTPEDGDV